MEAALSSPPSGPGPAHRKDPQRSRVTNGSAFLPKGDERSGWVRRCRDVVSAHVADLGGPENISEAERSIIRRAAVLTTELENLEARFAENGQASAADLDLYSRAAANLRRLLEAIGLKRVPRDVTLSDYLAADQDQGDAEP